RQLADRLHQPGACRERPGPEVSTCPVAHDAPVRDALGLVELFWGDLIGHVGLLAFSSGPKSWHRFWRSTCSPAGVNWSVGPRALDRGPPGGGQGGRGAGRPADPRLFLLTAAALRGVDAPMHRACCGRTLAPGTPFRGPAARVVASARSLSQLPPPFRAR